MKKIKIFAAVLTFCTATFAGYTAYEKATMTDAERMILANIEALTGDNPETTYSNAFEVSAVCEKCGETYIVCMWDPEGNNNDCTETSCGC